MKCCFAVISLFIFQGWLFAGLPATEISSTEYYPGFGNLTQTEIAVNNVTTISSPANLGTREPTIDLSMTTATGTIAAKTETHSEYALPYSKSSELEEKLQLLSCDLPLLPSESRLWKGNETHELLLPVKVSFFNRTTTTEHHNKYRP